MALLNKSNRMDRKGIDYEVNAISLDHYTDSALPAASAENEGSLVYNTTQKSLLFSDGTEWLVLIGGTGGEIDAEDVTFDPSSAPGVTATDVQGAIEELATAVDNL